VTVGFVMLSHQRLDRAAQLALHLSRAGCPVAVHVDANAPVAEFTRFAAGMQGVADVSLVARRPTPWGSWGLVAATLDAAATLLGTYPDLTHVALISSACLPLRPLDELAAFLGARPGVDFIESVTIRDVSWAQGGLDAERFALYFPFDWKRQRRRFDLAVRVQRSLGVRRRIPEGIVPHMGSQWWCLTRTTLEAILSHPRRAAWETYFRQVWIPDESFFQTVVRQVSDRVESRSLTFSRFDVQGRPRVFYDDHLQLLRSTDCFFARKIWPGAEGLYRHLLTPDFAMPRSGAPSPQRIDPVLAAMSARRQAGRPGLAATGRYPDAAVAEPPTAAPYTVLHGLADLLPGLPGWLAEARGTRVHGHLFAPDRAHFADGATVFAGGLADSAALRDYDPQAFLRNLVWATLGEPQTFLFGPGDSRDILSVLVRDPNARIRVVTGAWAIGLWQSGASPETVRSEAAHLQRAETDMLAILTAPGRAADVRVWSLGAALSDVGAVLEDVLAAVPAGPMAQDDPPPPPAPVDLRGFDAFVVGLRDRGMLPRLVGDLPEAAPPARPVQRRKPHGVE
jgi:hypothetical protein